MRVSVPGRGRRHPGRCPQAGERRPGGGHPCVWAEGSSPASPSPGTGHRELTRVENDLKRLPSPSLADPVDQDLGLEGSRTLTPGHLPHYPTNSP